MTAGLERDVERRGAEVRQATGLDSVDLGVGAAVLGVPALPEDLILARDHRTDDGIGPDRADSPLREVDRAREMHVVGGGAA